MKKKTKNELRNAKHASLISVIFYIFLILIEIVLIFNRNLEDDFRFTSIGIELILLISLFFITVGYLRAAKKYKKKSFKTILTLNFTVHFLLLLAFIIIKNIQDNLAYFLTLIIILGVISIFMGINLRKLKAKIPKFTSSVSILYFLFAIFSMSVVLIFLLNPLMVFLKLYEYKLFTILEKRIN